MPSQGRRTEEDRRDPLKLSEARLLSLLMHLPDAVIVTSGDRIGFVNAAAQRLLGTAGPTLVGRPAAEVLPKGSLAADRARLAALQAVTYPVPMMEEEVVRPDGGTRIVETTAILIEDDAEASIVSIMRDITDFKKTQNNLLEAHADLQRLLSARDRIQEDERKRIARELHDDLQQSLSAIRIDIRMAADRLGTDAEGASELLARIDSLALAAIGSTRRIVNDLRPQVLEEQDLVPALEALASQFSQRTGIACLFELNRGAIEALRLSTASTTCLYRVAQEALNNVIKHAHASAVRLQLLPSDEGRLVLRIVDNGRGIDMAGARSPGSFGLLGMRERVRAVGGALRIDSSPGKGTTVEVHVAASRTDLPSAVPASPNPPAGHRPERGHDSASSPDGPRRGAAEHERLSTDAAEGSKNPALQDVIDAIAAHVAVLDGDGEIQLVNQAWRDFAEQNGAPGMRGCGPGVNYLEICRRSAATERSAQGVLRGLVSVLDGSRPAFASDYPCDGPDEPRWFRMHAAPIVGGGALVTHYNLGTGSGARRRAA